MNPILQKSKAQLQQEMKSLLDRVDHKVDESAQTVKQTSNESGKSNNIEQVNLLKRLRFKIQNLQAVVLDTSESAWETLGKQLTKDFKEIEQDWADIDSIR